VLRQQRRTNLELQKRNLKLGELLQTLKDFAGHGRWLGYLRDLRIDERTAQRLVRLAKSALGQRIRDLAPDLADRLPLDLRALERMMAWSAEQVQEYFEDPSREPLRRKKATAPTAADIPEESGDDESSLSTDQQAMTPAAHIRRSVRPVKMRPAGANQRSPEAARVEQSGCIERSLALCAELRELEPAIIAEAQKFALPTQVAEVYGETSKALEWDRATKESH
jgi:hypothetical protein